MISLLVVNYRSSALAAEAIRSARASTTRPIQAVVVDNSCDAEEAARLRPHADVVIASAVNRGYAGAINDGRRACTGDALVVSNPDVTFGTGAIDRLVDVLGDYVVAGPALFWDEKAEWLLPPSELHTGREVLDAAIASRSRPWRSIRDRRRIRSRIAFWSRTSVEPIEAISGAVMAIRSSDFDEIDGFDERFPLYFEENDFVRQLQQRRRRIAYVPDAHCRHLYNQSAAQATDHASASYAQSEQKYLAKWNGPLAARLLKRLERPVAPMSAPTLEGPLKIERPETVVVEASPLSSFETAAGHFPHGNSIDVPNDVWESYRSEVLYLRVVDRSSARVLATYARYKS